MQKLEAMNLIDNFLFQEVARNKEYGGEFCRIILETILGREIKEVEMMLKWKRVFPERHWKAMGSDWMPW